MAANKRVVVTGLGLVTSIGIGEAEVWDNLMAGNGGFQRLRTFDPSEHRVQHGAEVDLAALDSRQHGRMRKFDRTLRFALEASQQALEQASRLPDEDRVPQAVASVWGSGIGPVESIESAHDRFVAKGPSGIRPSAVPNIMSNRISAGVSIHFQLTGTNQVVVSACTSSTNALGTAFRMVRHGYADAVICGGVEATFTPFYYGIWNNLGVLSKHPDPSRAVRPFDAERDGMLLGEGAAVLFLESLESAERRRVRPRAEIVGYGESSDATHITAPSANGQAAAIREALGDAGLGPDEIGYINAHGTGTKANDTTESAAIRAALGAAGARIPVGAMKSFFGHTLGASGVIEIASSIMALERGIAPPNRNLDQPDPECDLTLIGKEPHPLSSGVAIKNSFGFGGGNAVVVLRRFET